MAILGLKRDSLIHEEDCSAVLSPLSLRIYVIICRPGIQDHNSSGIEVERCGLQTATEGLTKDATELHWDWSPWISPSLLLQFWQFIRNCSLVSPNFMDMQC